LWFWTFLTNNRWGAFPQMCEQGGNLKNSRDVQTPFYQNMIYYT
jgi:hypothetical protein